LTETTILDGSDDRVIEQAASVLRVGGVVAFPTETVYGLGADAFNAVAVAKIFELKKRPHFDPLIVHISRKDWVEKLVSAVPAKSELLMNRFWPGPLTIIMEKKDVIPAIVTAGLSTVAVRMPQHPVALRLIESLGRPVAAPSANPFGYVSTTCARDVAALFGRRLPLVIDGGSCGYGIESTIVSVRQDRVILHRHGSVSVEELTDLVGPVFEKERDDGTCESPGELPYHYAPQTPLVIIDKPSDISVEESCFLAFLPPAGDVRARHVLVLSEKGDLREAAARFFSYLIQLDRKSAQIIYAEKIPEKGLGKAIMERLRKAARKSDLRKPIDNGKITC
jgi:L-threonylcarbamoyladenylate synthase